MNMNVITTANPLIQSAQAEALGTPTKEIKGRPNYAFQPETKVELEGTVRTALQSLQKAMGNQSSAARALPEQIQKIISNIMRNSFSLEESVSQGLTSALQGQRASTEQLNVLAKVLNRLSISLPHSNAVLSENLQTLLQSLKLAAGQNGKLLDTTLLHKSFMQLMDGKPFSELPQGLQFLLGQNPQAGQATGSLQILQQLMKQLFPSLPVPQMKNAAATSNGQAILQGQEETAQQTAGNAQTDGAASKADSNLLRQTSAALRENIAAKANENMGQVGGAKTESTAGKTGPNILKQASAALRETIAAKADGNIGQTTGRAQMDGAASRASAPLESGGKLNQPSEAGKILRPTEDASTQKNVADTLKNVLHNARDDQSVKNVASLFSAIRTNLQMAGAKAKDPNAAYLRALLTTKPFQNTPELMQTLKTLAKELLSQNRDQLGNQEAALLRSLAGGGQKVLSGGDVRIMQEMIRVIEQNLPYAVKNTALKHHMPEAVKLWTLAQLSELADLQNVGEKEIYRASKNVNDFVSMLKTSVSADSSQTQGVEKSMVMMLPMYLGENETVYPSYIHIFHQQKENGRGDIEKKETWFRVCMLTENIGAVELVFRMYGRRMDLRVAFTDEEAAIYFPYYMQNIREGFRDLNLQLADVRISVIGDSDEL